MKPNFVYRARVVSVYDGDTVRVDIDLGFGILIKNQAVRLLNINTPEVRGESRSLGLKVRDWLRERVLNREIVLRTHKDKTGKYGRWLGELWIDGLCINEQLIEQGWEAQY